ncbi:MAG: hypothetical protein E6J43_03500, partial [Chloroflexi bacterium]
MHGSESRKNRSSTGGPLGLTGWITRAAAHHPWRTLGAWVLLVAVAFGVSGMMKTSSNTATAGTEATKAQDLIKGRLREQTPPEEFIVIESQTATADQLAFASFVDSFVGELDEAEGVDSVASYRNGGEGLVSADGHTALVTARLTGDKEDAVDTAKPLVGVVQRADGTDGFRVTTVGFGSVEGEVNTLLTDTLEQGELIGIAIALVVLLVVFGAAVAAGLPIIVALLSIFVAIGS